MHIKFSNPKGDAKAAVGYIMRQTQPKKDHEEIEVLRGNPQTTQDLAMSLGFKNTYSSAVIRWHQDDKPTPAQINEVIDSFEAFAFAGLERDSYDMLVVQHTENNDPHLHIIVPRVELQTGKSMNIAPPKFNKDHSRHHEFDHVRDFFNEKYGWKSPDIEANPENARTTQLGLNRGSRKALLAAVDSYVLDLIETGDIKDRASLCQQLEAAGLIVENQENKFVLIKDPEDEKMKKGMRLKGAMYAKDFNRDKWLKTASERQEGKAQENSQQSLENLGRRLGNASKKRAEYNEKRYCQSQPKSNGQDAAQGLESSPDDLSLSSIQPDDFRGDLAPIPQQNDHTTGLQANSVQQSSAGAGMRTKRLASPKNSRRQRHNLTPQQLDTQLEAILRMIEAIARMLGFNPSLSTNFQQGVNNDRDRDQISEAIASSKRANELTQSSLERTGRSVERASRSVIRNADRASERTDEIQQVFKQTAYEFERANKLADELEQHREQEQQQNNSGDFNYSFK